MIDQPPPVVHDVFFVDVYAFYEVSLNQFLCICCDVSMMLSN